MYWRTSAAHIIQFERVCSRVFEGHLNEPPLHAKICFATCSNFQQFHFRGARKVSELEKFSRVAETEQQARVSWMMDRVVSHFVMYARAPFPTVT